MKYEVIWSQFAEIQIDIIFNYYKSEAGNVVANKIIEKIINSSLILEKHPKLGQIEPLLVGRKITYHYIYCQSYKLIYSVDDTKKLIMIADVFDTRQLPEKLLRNKE